MIPYTYYELEAKLKEIYEGEVFVVPSNLDHAYQMLHVAQSYINNERQKLISILKKA